jgi:hypothetical protein
LFPLHLSHLVRPATVINQCIFSSSLICFLLLWADQCILQSITKFLSMKTRDLAAGSIRSWSVWHRMASTMTHPPG